MSTYAESILDANISVGFQGGPEFSTNIVKSRSGYEARNQNNSLILKNYEFDSNQIYNIALLDDLFNFFSAMQGQLYHFLIKDFIDYKMPRTQIAIGDGVEDTFIIYKTYGNAFNSIQKRIWRPIQDVNLQVWVNDILQTFDTDYGVACNTGEIVFETPPPDLAIIEVACHFYTIVRFGSDKFNGVVQNGVLRGVEGFRIQE